MTQAFYRRGDVSSHPMSFDEFVARFGDKRYEYVDGAALPRGPEITGANGAPDVAPKSMLHHLIAARLGYFVGQHVLKHRLGIPLMAGVGFFMTQEPPELREADFAVLTPDSARRAKMGEWIPFPPDFAAEIVSEWDNEAYIQRKAAGYMAHGTRLLWVIRPQTQTVEVYRPGEAVRMLESVNTLEDEVVMPGLRVAVSGLFELV